MQQLFNLPNDAVTELPRLRLGLAGFTEGQCKTIAKTLTKTLPDQPAWQVCPFQLADAWLLSGENSAPSPQSNQDMLRIAPGLPGDKALTLNLSEINRPLAFSLPLVSPDIEAKLTFTPDYEASLLGVLCAFEQWLQPLRAKFLLSSQLMQRESQLKRMVYHVSSKGQLLAILDFAEWRIGLLPEATHEQFEKAMWETRPSQANAMPLHFVQSSVEQLRWIYAQHTQQDVLPARYKRQPIYFSQTPNVPQTWLEPSHLLLLRELSVRPATLKELTERTALTADELAREVACLYFAGSLTTTADKAATRAYVDVNARSAKESKARAVESPAAKTPRRQPAAPTIFNSTLPPDSGGGYDHDLTAPAGLQRH